MNQGPTGQGKAGRAILEGSHALLALQAKAKPKALTRQRQQEMEKQRPKQRQRPWERDLQRSQQQGPWKGKKGNSGCLRKTCAKNPESVYLCGATIEGASFIDDIWAALEKNALTKQEAKDLRGQLCSQHGC